MTQPQETAEAAAEAEPVYDDYDLAPSDTEVRQFEQERWIRPPGATEVLLVRHGASQAFIPGEPFPMLGDQGDPALAPKGHEQAAAMAKRLAHEPIDALYVSSLRRTQQTFAPLAERLGMTPTIEHDLREVALGEWDGGRIRQFAADNHPLYERLHIERRWDVIPGAESNEQLIGRCMAALGRIADAHPDQLVAACVHGGVIGAVLAHITESTPFSFGGSDNCSVTQVVRCDGDWVLRRFNDCSHLDDFLHHA
ncbi:MAG: histidine phosphatase family protein [Acidimicrobiales bacterium]|nr:histidine phosphatase family protein [Acidimicrobiales bacterium]MXY01379.1 histidine phosphatase family protein [Acidimicrobiales bacterium]MYA81818.1 histidine phosphatase family protein [Acidimicrobiales bacterium]MYG89503.1 histidine phosphatase family protein [Acidimicrobiales bacterium]MYH74147.1 histidine phosphatase family protein [Acidimicrobiales bacterium]